MDLAAPEALPKDTCREGSLPGWVSIFFVVTSYKETRFLLLPWSFYNRLEVLKCEISAFGVLSKSVDELDFK